MYEYMYVCMYVFTNTHVLTYVWMRMILYSTVQGTYAVLNTVLLPTVPYSVGVGYEYIIVGRIQVPYVIVHTNAA
jgi:hypothetical protein